MPLFFSGEKLIFNTGNITAGIYLLQAFSKNKYWSEKIIVQ
jgi:hypothetical protein